MSRYVGLAFVLLSLSQVFCKVAASEPQSEEDPTKESSPQFMYMERLRKVTRTLTDGVDTNAEDTQTPGTLLATSLKDTYTNGKQIGGGGVSDLRFTIPQQSESAIASKEETRAISKSELWLFTNFTNTPRDNRWYQITLGFVFTLEGFNRPVETQVENLLWRGSDECIMVDLTPQTKIIDRKLKKRNLNATVVDVKVTVHHKEEYHGPSTPRAQEWQDTCSSLSQRTTNTSFLVLKYFPDDEGEIVEERRKKKRSIVDVLPPPTNRSLATGCSLRELNVRLNEVLGNWIVSPTDKIDVGICAGTCDLVQSRALFSPQAMLMDRLSNMGLSTVSNYNYKVSCVAVTLTPINVLIRMEASYILFNLPIKAHTCGCR